MTASDGTSTRGRRFEGRVVFVSGAGSGIGRVLCHRFAGEGAVVAAADVDDLSVRETAAAVNAQQGEARAYHVDVSRRLDVEAATRAVLDEFGRIDVLVNNAGVSSDTPFEEVGDEEWDRILGVVLKGTFLCSQSVLPAMVKAGGGSIVNIGSVNGINFIAQDVYSAAKAGLLSLTRGVALGYGTKGVRCNLVAPGSIRTPTWDDRLKSDPKLLERLTKWYPLARIGAPDDVANAVLFLASDEASWITGTCLTVDGGLLAGNVGMRADVLNTWDPT